MRRSHRGAYVLIFIGAIFLLINLGVLPVAEVRQLFAQWWPLLLILIGAWLLARPGKDG